MGIGGAGHLPVAWQRSLELPTQVFLIRLLPYSVDHLN